MSIDVEELAEKIADRLHKSILQLPDHVADQLKTYYQWSTRTMICGGEWPIAMDTRITADGGIEITLTDAMGVPVFKRVLHP